MNPSHKIIKNTFWLTIQPIVLNVISLFIIGYITRTLGESDYGKFTFAFAFPFLFSLLTDLGINPFLTRIVVDMKSEAVTIIGKIVCFRLFLSILSYLLVVLVVYTFNFSESVRIVVCIAGLTLIFNAITNTMNAVMQGYEKMESVALAQFYSGLILTIGSVLVLLIGFRLTGLTVVYTLGSFLWMVFAIGYCMRIADIKPIFFDFEIVKIVLKRGFPFFLPGICSIISTKSGVIILAKVSGDASLGLFTAANNLIEKLTIIPDGICTSVFPALSGLHQKNEEFAQEVTRKAVLYLFLLSLPLALGFIILSQSVIVLIYGADFVKSAAILRILSIGMIFMFLMNLEMRILAAIRLESKGSVIFFLTSVFYLLSCLVFIPKFGVDGLAFSSSGIYLINFLMFFSVIKKNSKLKIFKGAKFVRIFLATMMMGAVLFILRNCNIFVSFFSAVFVYFSAIYFLKVITVADLKKFIDLMGKRDIPLGNVIAAKN